MLRLLATEKRGNNSNTLLSLGNYVITFLNQHHDICAVGRVNAPISVCCHLDYLWLEILLNLPPTVFIARSAACASKSEKSRINFTARFAAIHCLAMNPAAKCRIRVHTPFKGVS